MIQIRHRIGFLLSGIRVLHYTKMMANEFSWFCVRSLDYIHIIYKYI